MKLYSTLTSPYGRIVRIVLAELGLAGRVPVEVPATRQPGSPYYDLNPSGRVPFLLLDDGTGIEDSSVICEYLHRGADGPSLLAPPGEAGFEARRIEASARSMLDGVSLWAREIAYRDPAIHSPIIMAHEEARAGRMADLFEGLVEGAVLSGPFNLAQVTLACTLHGRGNRPPPFDWREGRPKLSAWVERIGQRESVASTVPGA